MAMSNYLEEKLIKSVYNGVAYTPPTEHWIGLYNTNPNDDNSGTELSGNGYVRKQFTPNTPTGPDWVVSNSADVTWPTATGNWATINYIAIFDGAAGNMLDYGPITTPVDVLTDGIFKVLAGDLDIQYN